MNKKGFTLIELLAVIVILAIIALIATPIILNVIDTARKGAKESSVLGYIDALEKRIMMAEVDSSATKITAGVYNVGQLRTLKVEVKGEMPEDTSVVVINEKGAVSEGWFTYENTNLKIYYNGKKAIASTDDNYYDDENIQHNELPTPGSLPDNNSSSSTPEPNLPSIAIEIRYLGNTVNNTVQLAQGSSTQVSLTPDWGYLDNYNCSTGITISNIEDYSGNNQTITITNNSASSGTCTFVYEDFQTGENPEI